MKSVLGGIDKQKESEPAAELNVDKRENVTILYHWTRRKALDNLKDNHATEMSLIENIMSPTKITREQETAALQNTATTFNKSKKHSNEKITKEGDTKRSTGRGRGSSFG